MTTGLSIPEINDLLANGASIAEDGTIQLASIIPTKEPTELNVEEAIVPIASDVQKDPEADGDLPYEGDESKTFAIVAFIGVLASILILVGILLLVRLRKQTGQNTRVPNEDKGGRNNETNNCPTS